MRDTKSDLDYDDVTQKDLGTPERNLVAAIMQRAIDDAYGQSKDIPRHEKRGARTWLRTGEEYEWSFVWACKSLDLDPQSVIDALNNIAKKESESEDTSTDDES